MGVLKRLLFAAWAVVYSGGCRSPEEPPVAAVTRVGPVDRGVLEAPSSIEPPPPPSPPVRARALLQSDLGGTLWCVSPDGKRAMEAGGRNRFQLRLWDLELGAFLASVNTSGEAITAISWSATVPLVLTEQGHLYRVHWPSAALEALPSVTCHPLSMTSNAQGVVAVAGRGCVAVLDEGKWSYRFSPALQRPLGLAISRTSVAGVGTDLNGELLLLLERHRAEESGNASPAGEESTGSLIRLGPTGAPGQAGPTWGRIRWTATPDQLDIAVDRWGVLRWNVTSGAPVYSRSPLPEEVSDVHLLPGTDGYLVLTRRARVEERDFTSGQPRWSGALGVPPASPLPRFLSMSETGLRGVVALERPTPVDLSSWRRLAPIPASSPLTPLALEWSPEAEALLFTTASREGAGWRLNVVQWSLAGIQPPRLMDLGFEPDPDGQVVRPAIPFALSPDGRTMAIRTAESVQVFELASGARAGRLRLKGVVGIAFHPDGEGLYAATEEGDLLRWEAAGAENAEQVTRYGEGIRTLVGSAAQGALAVAVGGEASGKGYLEILAVERHQVLGRAALSATPSKLVTGGDGLFAGIVPQAGVRLWTARAQVKGALPEAGARAIAMDPAGRLVAFGENELSLWPLAGSRGKRGAQRLADLAGPLEAVAIGPGGACVFAADSTGEIGVYDRKGSRQVSLVVYGRDRWLAYTADGAYAGSPEGISSLRLSTGESAVLPGSIAGLESAQRVWQTLARACSIPGRTDRHGRSR